MSRQWPTSVPVSDNRVLMGYLLRTAADQQEQTIHSTDREADLRSALISLIGLFKSTFTTSADSAFSVTCVCVCVCMCVLRVCLYIGHVF